MSKRKGSDKGSEQQSKRAHKDTDKEETKKKWCAFCLKGFPDTVKGYPGCMGGADVWWCSEACKEGTADIDSEMGKEEKKEKLKPKEIKCYVGQRKFRGAQAKRKGAITVDVSSGATGCPFGKGSGKSLSPMYVEVEVDDLLRVEEEVPAAEWAKLKKRRVKFEMWYQYKRVYDEADPNPKFNLGHWDEKTGKPTAQYYADLKLAFTDKNSKNPNKGIRRPLKVAKVLARRRRKGNKDELKVKGMWFGGALLNHEQSKERAYTPVYSRAIRDLPFTAEIVEHMLTEGAKELMFIEFDGPKYEQFREGREFTPELFASIIHSKERLGHCWVVVDVVTKAALHRLNADQ